MSFYLWQSQGFENLISSGFVPIKISDLGNYFNPDYISMYIGLKCKHKLMANK